MTQHYITSCCIINVFLKLTIKISLAKVGLNSQVGIVYLLMQTQSVYSFKNNLNQIIKKDSVYITANSIKVALKKRSNMRTKGLSGLTSFIPEYITIRTFSTKFKN